MGSIRIVLLYAASLGAAAFFMGVVDGLFYQPAAFTRQFLSFTLGRDDIYYACLTLFFALLCAACALAAKIGSKAKPDSLRFFMFTAGNFVLFSIWLWALGWMQISGTMSSGVNRPLELWRIGPLSAKVNTFDFPALIVFSFALHALLLYFSLKKNFLAANLSGLSVSPKAARPALKHA